MAKPIEDYDEYVAINKMANIESKVKGVNIVKSPDEIEGKVILSMKTILLDEVSYVVTMTEDGFLFCASYAKCGESFSMDSVPEFDLEKIATEEIDFGYMTHAAHIFDLYFEMDLITNFERNLLNRNFPLLKARVEVDVKIARLEFSIEQAVLNEDFKEAEKLKKKLDELQ
jgi:hypothetical protein